MDKLGFFQVGKSYFREKQHIPCVLQAWIELNCFCLWLRHTNHKVTHPFTKQWLWWRHLFVLKMHLNDFRIKRGSINVTGPSWNDFWLKLISTATSPWTWMNSSGTYASLNDVTIFNTKLLNIVKRGLKQAARKRVQCGPTTTEKIEIFKKY